ncbi:hypothetical protein EV175_002880 [Coemansia sp. RSA 1933]|nr:hypothetical protein EV175_002880 [Coemansia sp. RSA 1933]
MHRAYMNMPLSRQNIRFNPWSLILELLDDPRVEINASNPVVLRGRALLATIARLGQVTPDNMLTQRPLLARYVQSSKAFVPLPQREDTGSDIVLTSSQHAALSQIQFPRFIANKYTTHVSVVALPEKMEGSNAARRAQWDRSWLSANLTILELQATFLKHRVLFGKRLDMAQQSRLLISNAFEHAPGLVLNVIMSWNDDYRKILTPYAIQRLCAACFSNPDTIREAIVQAWQMYDWLIYHSPALRRNNNIGVGDAYAVAVKLFRSLESFDNLAEAHNCFHRVQASRPNPSDARMMRLLASDRKLLTRYMNIVAQLRGHWRPKPAATATHRHGIH